MKAWPNLCILHLNYSHGRMQIVVKNNLFNAILIKWCNFLIEPVFHCTAYVPQDWLSDNYIWCRTYEQEQMAHQMKNDETAGSVFNWFMQHLSPALIFKIVTISVWKSPCSSSFRTIFHFSLRQLRNIH